MDGLKSRFGFFKRKTPPINKGCVNEPIHFNNSLSLKNFQLFPWIIIQVRRSKESTLISIKTLPKISSSKNQFFINLEKWNILKGRDDLIMGRILLAVTTPWTRPVRGGCPGSPPWWVAGCLRRHIRGHEMTSAASTRPSHRGRPNQAEQFRRNRVAVYI